MALVYFLFCLIYSEFCLTYCVSIKKENAHESQTSMCLKDGWHSLFACPVMHEFILYNVHMYIHMDFIAFFHMLEC